jgi:hypothetical protein
MGIGENAEAEAILAQQETLADPVIRDRQDRKVRKANRVRQRQPSRKRCRHHLSQ